MTYTRDFMVLPLQLEYTGILFSDYDIKTEKNIRYIVASGNRRKEQIRFWDTTLNDNPFNDLINIFKRYYKKTEYHEMDNKDKELFDNNLVNWVRTYGFLFSNRTGKERFMEVVSKCKKLYDLWVKYKDISDGNWEGLKSWLIVETFNDSASLVCPSKENKGSHEVYEAGCITSFKKRPGDLDLKDYSIAGMRYIVSRIVEGINDISMSYKGIETIDNTDIIDYKVDAPTLSSPSLLSILYIHFYSLLQLNVRVCPICLKPHNKRPNSVGCSKRCNETAKKRRQKGKNPVVS